MAVAVGAVVQAAAVVAVVSLLPQLASLLVVSRRANGVALAALAERFYATAISAIRVSVRLAS